MFVEFQNIRGPLLKEQVNTILGSLLLGSVGLWAAMFIWNVTNGTNPIDRAIESAMVQSVLMAND